MARARVPILLGCGVAVFVAAVACSQKSPRPDALGDCTPVGDASCVGSVNGGMNNIAEGGTDGAAETSSDASSCGSAAQYVTTSNLACGPCIASSCCQAELACTGAACIPLLQCLVNCTAGDQVCIGTCENGTPSGVTPYNDFQSCLAQNCSPACPTLPTATAGDF